ncbi:MULTISPECIES: multidrug effflux MFS transporter [Rhizobium]|uniref:multidrug effflux MFS transporter n=1 Tax=Rhizobium TaxID=379 RepID=UPI0004084569|nr:MULTISPECIES: multidrug effflux MFS transporter [Rhizobium]MCS0460268.1 hypothetical protein [Rhizobium favelukesii]UFS85418.1 hypothetical protein LPB79_38025 [Rhizobium sp. T136]
MIFLLSTLVAIGAMSINLYLSALPEFGAVFGASAGTMQLTAFGFLIGLACGGHISPASRPARAETAACSRVLAALRMRRVSSPRA